MTNNDLCPGVLDKMMKTQVIYSIYLGSTLSGAVNVINFNSKHEVPDTIGDFCSRFFVKDNELSELLQGVIINNTLENFKVLLSLVMKLICFEVLFLNSQKSECIAQYLSVLKIFCFTQKEAGLVNAIVDKAINKFSQGA